MTSAVFSRLRVWKKSNRIRKEKRCYFSFDFTLSSEPEDPIVKGFIDTVWFIQIIKTRKLKKNPEKYFRVWIFLMSSTWTGWNAAKTWTCSHIKSLFLKHPTGCLLHCQAIHQDQGLKPLTVFLRDGSKK